jgi:hypothetical protein
MYQFMYDIYVCRSVPSWCPCWVPRARRSGSATRPPPWRRRHSARPCDARARARARRPRPASSQRRQHLKPGGQRPFRQPAWRRPRRRCCGMHLRRGTETAGLRLPLMILCLQLPVLLCHQPTATARCGRRWPRRPVVAPRLVASQLVQARAAATAIRRRPARPPASHLRPLAELLLLEQLAHHHRPAPAAAPAPRRATARRCRRGAPCRRRRCRCSGRWCRTRCWRTS